MTITIPGWVLWVVGVPVVLVLLALAYVGFQMIINDPFRNWR